MVNNFICLTFELCLSTSFLSSLSFKLSNSRARQLFKKIYPFYQNMIKARSLHVCMGSSIRKASLRHYLS